MSDRIFCPSVTRTVTQQALNLNLGHVTYCVDGILWVPMMYLSQILRNASRNIHSIDSV